MKRLIIAEIFINSRETYGYRRISCVLKKMGIILSEKVVRRIMKEEALKVRKPQKRNTFRDGGADKNLDFHRAPKGAFLCIQKRKKKSH